MTFTQEAIAAYEHQKAEQNKAQFEKDRQRGFEAANWFLKLFGVQPDSFEPGGIVYKDDLVFKFDNSFREPSFRLWGKCPRCQVECWSSPFINLVYLGEYLTEFRPSFEDHARCETKPEDKPNTWRDLLAEAIEMAIQMSRSEEI